MCGVSLASINLVGVIMRIPTSIFFAHLTFTSAAGIIWQSKAGAVWIKAALVVTEVTVRAAVGVDSQAVGAVSVRQAGYGYAADDCVLIHKEKKEENTEHK